MPTIIHFDMSAENPERAKKFYEDLLGWKIGTIGGFPDYYEIETRDLKGTTGPGGGITRRQGSAQPGITNYIGVPSLDQSLSKLITLGGKVVRPKETIPGYGTIALCADTENNLFGLFEEDKKEVVNNN